MTLKSDAKCKEKLTSGFKYDMRNLMIFHPTTQKSKNFTSMGYFCPKHMMFGLKKYRRVIFHDPEQWWKIWINRDLVVSWPEELGKLSWEHLSLKFVYRLMGSFCPKNMFQLENFRGIMCHDTEGCCKI